MEVADSDSTLRDRGRGSRPGLDSVEEGKVRGVMAEMREGYKESGEESVLRGRGERAVIYSWVGFYIRVSYSRG